MRNGGKTIFVVTHQPVVLEAAADESLLLSAGLLAARERGLPEYLGLLSTSPRLTRVPREGDGR